MSTPKEGRLSTIWHELREYLDLNIEYAKLTAAEKVAVLLTATASVLVVGVLGILIFFFVSLAAVYWLARAGMSVALAFTIMAGFYVLLLVLFYIFRKQLVLDPIARFISKLFMK